MSNSFEKLVETIKLLRQRCPWDSEQTDESLRPLTIEEVYELSQSIIKKDYNDQRKELGDVLLHIIMYALIAEENGRFNFDDVCNTLYDKLVFRHPHIFGDYKAETPEEVSKMWEEVKLKEKGGNKTVLSGIPDSLPTIIKAYRIQDKVSHSGFDWDNRNDVWEKVYEEIGEFKQELINGNAQNKENEFGDLIFALINAGRLYDINPDTALEHTNQKFIFRFNYIESKAKLQGKNLRDMTLAEMEEYWNEAKKLEKN